MRANQPRVDVRCMENVMRQKGRVAIKWCKEIGDGQLVFARPLPKGSPVEFRFSLSADGLLSVHGRDMTTGGEVNIEIATAAILSSHEIEEKRARTGAIAVS